jgi:hypothetical protein
LMFNTSAVDFSDAKIYYRIYFHNLAILYFKRFFKSGAFIIFSLNTTE